MGNHTITLADGTVLSNLGLNGTNYISSVPVDPAIFENNCSPITLTGEEGETITLEHGALVHVQPQADGTYWIAFRELTSHELEIIDLNEDITTLTAMVEMLMSTQALTISDQTLAANFTTLKQRHV